MSRNTIGVLMYHHHKLLDLMYSKHKVIYHKQAPEPMMNPDNFSMGVTSLLCFFTGCLRLAKLLITSLSVRSALFCTGLYTRGGVDKSLAL
jgi:hypothetical protein